MELKSGIISHSDGKIASERRQPKLLDNYDLWLYRMNLKVNFFAGTYYRVVRVVPQWPRCIEHFLASVTIIPVCCVFLWGCILYIPYKHPPPPGFLDLLTHYCRFRVLLPSLVNKHSLLWWDFTEWSNLVDRDDWIPIYHIFEKLSLFNRSIMVWHFHNCMILLCF